MQSELATDASPLTRPERLVSVRAILGPAGREPVGIEPLGVRPHARVALHEWQHHQHPLPALDAVPTAQHRVFAYEQQGLPLTGHAVVLEDVGSDTGPQQIHTASAGDYSVAAAIGITQDARLQWEKSAVVDAARAQFVLQQL